MQKQVFFVLMGGWDTHSDQLERLPKLITDLNDGEDDGSFAGRLIPEISVSQDAATLSRWMGVSESELNAALPDLQNFAQNDLGLMRS